LAGKTVQWKAQSGSLYGLTVNPAIVTTDSNGVATTKVLVMLPTGTTNKVITVDSYLSASFNNDTEYEASTCNAKVYGEFIMNYKNGDVNMDGYVDAIDFALLKKYLFDTGTAIDKLAADMNNDGNIDALDAALLKKALLGL
jgi:endoglucanase